MRADDDRVAAALELISAQQSMISDQGEQLRRLSRRVESLEAYRATSTTLTMARAVEERVVPPRADPRAEPETEPARPPRQRRSSRPVIAANVGVAQRLAAIVEHARAALDELAESTRHAALIDHEEKR